MIRLFSVYYPKRLLVLVAGEGIIVCASFLLAALIRLGPDSALVLNYQYGFGKILGVTVVALFCLHYFDLYDLQEVASRGDIWFRLFVVVGILSFFLAGLGLLFPRFMLANHTFMLGLSILALGLVLWRAAYNWLIRQSFLRERVHVVGEGERAKWLVKIIRAKPELGMDVMGWSGAMGGGSMNREALRDKLAEIAEKHNLDRVIIALEDRRGIMPVRELLDLRLSGVKVEDATGIVEKISGKIEVDSIHPSWLIFSEGFRLNPTFMFLRRFFSLVVSLVLLLAVLPLLPLIALAIKLTSPGPVLYAQKRVGRNGKVFTCYKFRTMRADAETAHGPSWAGDNDPRVTLVGRWLRRVRIDEIPQLWNVLRGEMGFVGPRPERPEFVEWLSREIPYYPLRHVIRPGITGWAQIRYQYGASLEESKEKLKFDLYYIKHMSLSFELMIVLESVKIVLLRRGAR
ncbi:MAG: polyprenyl glycosylphosphotransferase [Acidobacteria bacterium]|nr:MAG: polyprenyl glycosylphosphotransferase [Acidobacteriota bacterium]